MAQPFPDPGAVPGDYAVEWLVGRRRFTGDVALAPRRRPQIELHGALRRRKRSTSTGELVYTFPGPEVELPRLVGRLRSNEQVVVIGPVLWEWYLNDSRASGDGRSLVSTLRRSRMTGTNT